jgi:hypothetical protein
LTIDGAVLHSTEPYEYKNDATVSKIVPGSTVHSGGTKVKVYGTNLDTVQHPKIGVQLPTGEMTEEVKKVQYKVLFKYFLTHQSQRLWVSY